MKQTIVILILCQPLLSLAQSDTTHGIKWTEGLSWSQVLEKAKAENKNIFLDCFATWCGPCHEMEKGVYPNEEVGKTMNDKFISVKVQMDTTSYDNDPVKAWYKDASWIEKYFTVNAFPTFLFFSPDGKPLHKAVGYREAKNFIALAKDALNPNKQYYALLNNYQPGTIDTSELKGLARALRNLRDELAPKMAVEYLTRIPKCELSDPDNLLLMMQFGSDKKMQSIAADYFLSLSPRKYSTEVNLKLVRIFKTVPSIHNRTLKYLNGLTTNELSKQLPELMLFDKDSLAKSIADRYINSLKGGQMLTKQNIQLIRAFTWTPKDKGFKLFKDNERRIDKVMGEKTFAEIAIENIVIIKEYDSFFKAAIKNDTDNVPWDSIFMVVRNKYGYQLVEKLDRDVKSRLYSYLAKKNDKYWQEYIKYNMEVIEKDGYDTTVSEIKFLDVMLINNFVFNAVFYHSNDTGQMKTALRWMEGVLRRNPTEANNIDTYANLLYKLGRKEEAIQFEKKAVDLASTDKSQTHYLSSLQENLSKMQKGIPTWIREN